MYILCNFHWNEEDSVFEHGIQLWYPNTSVGFSVFHYTLKADFPWQPLYSIQKTYLSDITYRHINHMYKYILYHSHKEKVGGGCWWMTFFPNQDPALQTASIILSEYIIHRSSLTNTVRLGDLMTPWGNIEICQMTNIFTLAIQEIFIIEILYLCTICFLWSMW